MAHHLRVTGSRACFRRPEFRRDFVTYDAMTPLAANRIFAAIHATPALCWIIERIAVVTPIRVAWEQPDVVGRRLSYLADVEYVITARFELTESASPADNAARHAATFRRRAARGQSAHPIHLGLAQFPGSFSVVDPTDFELISEHREQAIDLGWMIYDTAGPPDARARYFRAFLVDGIITVPPPDHPSLMV